MACLVLAALSFGWNVPAASGAQRPRTVLLVLPRDPGSDHGAALVYRVIEDILRQSQGYDYQSIDLAGAAADRTPEQVRALVASARQAYDELELKTAILHLEQALKLAEDHPVSAVDAADYRWALTLLGASYHLLGESARGRKMFLRLLSIEPAARLDPTLFPPALTRAFDEAVAAARRLATGTLDIQPSPPGTEVWVDLAFRGVGPMQLALPEGRHLIRLQRRGFQPFGVRRDVLAGAEEVIRQTLSPLPGSPAVSSRAAALLTAADDEVPPPARELLERASARRLFWFQVAVSGSRLIVSGRLYALESRRPVPFPEQAFDMSQEQWQRQLEAVFSSFSADLGGRTLASLDTATPGPGSSDATRPPPQERKTSRTPWYATWWFWTASGGVAAGAIGLVLGLTLAQGGGSPRSGDVVFRF
jgi:tetratricopeptide (TPR) repeat protein